MKVYLVVYVDDSEIMENKVFLSYDKAIEFFKSCIGTLFLDLYAGAQDSKTDICSYMKNNSSDKWSFFDENLNNLDWYPPEKDFEEGKITMLTFCNDIRESTYVELSYVEAIF